jgi:2-hydroxychromene-2-carboxylate isomerase
VSLVLYGSFNCPYSFLASLRADRLAAASGRPVQWRAVVHDPSVPADGEPVSGELAVLLDQELAEIRGQLAPVSPTRRAARQCR